MWGGTAHLATGDMELSQVCVTSVYNYTEQRMPWNCPTRRCTLLPTWPSIKHSNGKNHRAMLSQIGFVFWVVLYGARGWTWWSLQVPSNSAYSMILWLDDSKPVYICLYYMCNNLKLLQQALQVYNLRLFLQHVLKALEEIHVYWCLMSYSMTLELQYLQVN